MGSISNDMLVASTDSLDVEDVDNMVEDGSVISCTSGAEKKSSKKKKKMVHKSTRSSKSPYFSETLLNTKKSPVWRSLRGTGSMHTESPAVRVPRELWLASLKKGTGFTQSLKSEYDSGHSNAGSSSNTPEYLKEALGMKKPRHSLLSTSGYMPGTPDYKDKEEMYNEILEQKKMINNLKSDIDVLRTKYHRQEDEIKKKEKRIEQLLDPSKNQESTRCLVEKKHGCCTVVITLKQKILKLEQQCRDLENTVNKLQADTKTSNIEELKIALEECFEEIQRLRIMNDTAEAQKKRALAEHRIPSKRQQMLNSTILRLTKLNKQLQEEVRSFKSDPSQTLCSAPASSSTKDFAGWSREELIQLIKELDKKQEEKKPKSSLHLPQNNDGHPQPVHPSPNPEKSESEEECKRLKELLKKVKEDRSELQTQLGKKDMEIKVLQQKINELKEENQQLRTAAAENSGTSLKEQEEIRRLNVKIKKLEAELEDCHRRVGAAAAEASGWKEDSSLDKAATVIQSAYRGHLIRLEHLVGAASTHLPKSSTSFSLQSQREDANLDEAAKVIQSAFRGHFERRKHLLGTSSTQLPMSSSTHSVQMKSPRGLFRNGNSEKTTSLNDEMEKTVTVIQAAYRGHLARTKTRSDSSVGRPNSAVSQRREALPSMKTSLLTELHSYNGKSESSDDIVEEEHEYDNDLEEEEEKASSPKIKPFNKSNRELFSPRKSKAAPPLFTRGTDSDDSDDIISSSLPLHRKGSYF
ncbi:IQ domain-containing protein E [Protopterus annectens]|uniref:IQ domain-containing protein E n=1 Tax=Protopterus annectens TaxID=7888 RepID=UPI001CFC3BE7|nr:IQ domain-containing protein E [Protopterus annectens]